MNRTLPTVSTPTSNKGFTLIELTIYMGLLGIFVVVLTDLLSSILDLRTDATVTSLVVSDGRYIRDRLSYDIRRSSSVSIPATVGASSSSLALVISGVTHTVAVTDGTLAAVVGSNSYALHTPGSSVSGFLVTRVGNGTGKDTVQIQFTLTGQSLIRDRQAETLEYQFTIGTR